MHSPKNCPRDHSPLVFLSGSYGGDGVDLSVSYCPRCAVAFTSVSPASTTTRRTCWSGIIATVA